MPKLALALITAPAALSLLLAAAPAADARDGYEETWESLSRHPVPEWFADAKFGIYAHWGPYSVPAFDNEWYPRNMYQEGSGVLEHHRATWGDPSVFGYKDFIPLFTAEEFDAEAWAELFVQAGAKFAGPVAEHHDGFSMWASDVNRWNAGDMGPKRDIVGELVTALRARNVRIVTSFHHAFNIQGYYTAKEGWDTADPAYHDLYGQFADRDEAYDRWFEKIREVVDRYQPDQIWFDFGLADVPDAYKRRMAAYYYNHESEWGRPVIITRKGEHLPPGVGVLDIERAKMEGPAPFLWQTDDSVAVNSWCWVEGLQLKPAEELLHELIDIVSKNGVLLLNVAPKADGTIPDDQRALLLEMGDWLRVNGEAVYGTRPWLTHGEGPSLRDAGRGFGGEQVRFTGEDIRFTQTPDALYAICLGWPGESVSLASVRIDAAAPEAQASLLGHDEPLRFEVVDGRITVDLPNLPEADRPCRHAYTLKLEGFETSLSDEARFALGGATTLDADHAVLDGERIRLESRGGRSCVGYWDDAAESVHWLVRIPKAGEYAVRGEFAAAAGATRVTIEGADAPIAVDVPATAGWDDSTDVPLGALSFASPGVYHLVLRPEDPATWRPLNVWRLRLAPSGH